MVRDTSLRAYRELRAQGKDIPQRGQILLYLQVRYPAGFTRHELADNLGLPLQSVCGRVNELKELGWVDDTTTVQCKVTGNTSHAVRFKCKHECTHSGLDLEGFQYITECLDCGAELGAG